jgi:ribonuclease P protein component
MTPHATGHRFPRAMRLSGSGAFRTLRQGGARHLAGPLLVQSLPNDLKHARLGLAVPARVGTAAKRNRIKRLIREAFRLLQHEPSLRGFDWLVTIRAHQPLSLADYQKLLRDAGIESARSRARRREGGR